MSTIKINFKERVLLGFVLLSSLSACATKYVVQGSSGETSYLKLVPASGALPAASVTELWKVDDEFVCGRRSSSLKKMVGLVRGQVGSNYNPDGLKVESMHNFRMLFSSTVVNGLSSIYSADTATCDVTFSFSTEPNESYTIFFDNDRAGNCGVKVVNNDAPDISLPLNELSNHCS